MTSNRLDSTDGFASARRALAQARARGDRQHTLEVVAGVLDRVFRQQGASAAIDKWIGALDACIGGRYPPLPHRLESRLLSAARALLGRRPTHPALPLFASRAGRLIDAGDIAADDLTRAAGFLFEFAIRGGNFRLADRVIWRTDVRLAEFRVDPELRIDWLQAVALHAWLAVDHAVAFDAVGRALAIVAEAGLPEPYDAHEQGARAALSAQQLDRAAMHLGTMRREVRRPQDIAHLSFLSAGRALLAGDLALARLQIDACVREDESAVPLYFSTLWRLGRAHVAVAAGDHRLAERELAGVLARAGSLCWRYLEYSALLHRTWLRARQRRSGLAETDLARAMNLRRTHGFRNADPWWNASMVQDIVAVGIACGMGPQVEALAARLPVDMQG